MEEKASPSNCPKCSPKWLTLFGNLISLLLCFFILIFLMLTTDAKKVQDFARGINIFKNGDKIVTNNKKIKKTLLSKSSIKPNFEKTIAKISEVLKTTNYPQVILKKTDRGFMVILPDEFLFKPNSAFIKDENITKFFSKIALIVEKLPKNINIRVIGNTDDIEPSEKNSFMDNWELSTKKSVSVVRELIKNGISPYRVVAVGKAEFSPIASNSTQEGRAKNKRVELEFFKAKYIKESKIDIKKEEGM